MHAAALRPKAPAGTQIAFAPEQSSAVLQASVAHTFVASGAIPPHAGATGPRTHLPGVVPIGQSALLQHCPMGIEQVLTSGTLLRHTR
jgi:hypothetical protein